MPTPMAGESQSDYMHRCMTQVTSEGKDQQQAIAICMSMWENKAVSEEQDYATVDGQRVHRRDFAYVPDPNSPSTWKLPLHDEAHVRNALARFAVTDLPADAKREVARKIVAAAKKYGIDTSGFEAEHLGKSATASKAASPMTEYMQECIPHEMNDNGMDQQQAIAVCYSKWGEGEPPGPSKSAKTAAPLNRAWSTFQVRSVNEETRTIDGLASTPTTDRMSDIVEPMGGKFKLPLPLMWEHGKGFTRDPVGWVTHAEAKSGGIQIRAKFAKLDSPPSLKDDLDRAWALVKSGLVPGLSIGFTALATEPIKGSYGLRYTSWDWLELSAVAIPANADASITSIKSFDKAQLAVCRTKQPVVYLKPPSTRAGVPALARKSKMPIPLAEQITSFENKRAAAEARRTAIMDAAAEVGRTLEQAEEEEHDTLGLEIKSIDTHLKRLREHEANSKAKAVAVMSSGDGDDRVVQRAPSRIQVTSQLPKGSHFTRYAIALMVQKAGGCQNAADYAKQRWPDTPEVSYAIKDGAFRSTMEPITKAGVEAADTTTSGWASQLVPNATMMGSEFIDLLRPATIIGRIPGLRRVPFNVTVPIQSGGGTYGWVGEGVAKPVTSLTFTSVTLRWMKVAAIMVFTQELAMNSSPSAESVIRNDMVKGIANYLDSQFLDPTIAGVTNVQPKSITNGVTGNGAGGTTAAAFRTDFMETLSKINTNKQDPSQFVMVMSASVAGNLASLVNSTTSVREFPDLTYNGGTIYGMPVIVSQSASTYIVFLNPNEVLLAEDGGVQISVSDQATVEMSTTPEVGESSPVVTASTVMRSFWQSNLVGLRAERFITWSRARTSSVEYIYNAVYSG